LEEENRISNPSLGRGLGVLVRSPESQELCAN